VGLPFAPLFLTPIEKTNMTPSVLEMPVAPTETQTESQKFRITQIAFGDDTFSLKYQLADDIEWLKPKAHEISRFAPQIAFEIGSLKNVVRRVFQSEDRWGDADISIDALKLTYATDEDKGDKKLGIPPRPAGTLIRCAISASYQSAFIYAKKSSFLPLGTFEQNVDRDRAGLEGYLDESELKALEGILDEVSRELANQLNKKTVFKPMQLRLL
jgi:hypothetical protein